MARIDTIKVRRDTAANWTSVNPVLLDGEPGYEKDTKKIKYGDGTTAWNSLPYAGGSSSVITTPITYVTEAWASKAALATARRKGSSASIGGLIYLAGGWSGSTGTTAQVTHQMYDPVANTYTTKASLPTATAGAAGAAVGGKFYVMGGTNASSIATNLVYEYDPTTNTWATKAPMPSTKASCIAGVVNGKIYVLSTDGSTGHYEYDPVTDSWATKANPASATMSGRVACGVGDRLYLAGGLSAGVGVTSFYSYNPVTNTWTTKASFGTGRYNSIMDTVEGLVYLFSGQTSAGNGTTSVEIYDPILNVWSTGLASSVVRIDPLGAAANGVFYMIGGDDTSTAQTNNRAYTARDVSPVLVGTGNALVSSMTSGVSLKNRITGLSGPTVAVQSGQEIIPTGGDVDSNSVTTVTAFVVG